ncbi:FdhF/YdeP family oxidoreductase [Candidatus Albibeggiatoa sp. nov. NOAA]|uniref:FdhF/YdeP family oxidoreductase n=1 Tax=Candidatus Albibeggiatoa sp. nov. NOAA TaxID=3162724 RepID=UPI0032F587E6|nr:FdhF/YdeP family oxidoreductase [Thiotrichaceae bacterium]
MKNPNIIGGGTKKVLYTLNTVRRIGLLNSGKALTSNNACKACGLGMGGQKGGMVDELGEFPSVCNKSIQAQSTDIQPPIPEEIFAHTINELKELTGKEIEHLGRLNHPLFKSRHSNKFEPVEWDWAIDYAAKQFSESNPDKTFFYSSGRASNEAGFILQLLARLYGTNNVSNCSYYCHQATGVGMTNTLGTGTATVELEDLTETDLIFLIGANPASNHPRLTYQLKHCRERGGDIIVINPAKEAGLVKFAFPKSPKSMLKGGTDIASEYVQPKIGSDLYLLMGIGKYLVEHHQIDQDFINEHTSGFQNYQQQLTNLTWETICDQIGLSTETIHAVAKRYAQSKHTVFIWGMGVTHHKNGVENIEAIVNLALLRGMVGQRYAGLLPLRGHSNVQGIGTIGVKPTLPAHVFKKIEQQLNVKLPDSEGLDTLACLNKAAQGEIDAALLMGGNLYQASPNSDWTEAALNNIGFKLYLTTTLNLGHVHGVDNGEAIILPVTARDEEWQSTTQESMFNFVRMSSGGIQRHTHTKPETHILCDLAQALLPDCPVDFSAFKQHQHIRQTIAATIPGMEKLGNIDEAKQEFHIGGRLLHSTDFQTADHKAHFATHSLIVPSDDNEMFPLKLMTVRSEGQFNSIIYEEKDSYRGTQQRWVVMLSPVTLSKLKLQAGDKVNIVSQYGKMEQVTLHAFDLPEDNLMAYYPEANCLIGLESDPRSKTPAFKSVDVRIEKISDN